MPELPEVETIARGLATQVTGRQIVAVEKLDWPRMVEVPDMPDFLAHLPGRCIVSVGRRAKWLLFTLDADWTLALHLRMSGRISVTPADSSDLPDLHTHLVLALDNRQRIFFRDPRKFGRVRLLDAAGLAVLDHRFGPEPLSPAFDEHYLTQLLRKRRTSLKALLLNQERIAGLGNIYVDEALWHARLHPLRSAESLDTDEVKQLYLAIREVLEQGIRYGGSTLRDYRNGYGKMGENQAHFSVYQRMGQRCLCCGTPIERLIVAQRATHVCPSCQVLEDRVQSARAAR